MKLSCSQKDLAEALSIVNRAVSPNNTLPVLNNILLKTQGGKLFLSATNLDIAIHASIEAKVDKEGMITVPAKILNAYVPLLAGGTMSLSTVGDSTLELKSGSSFTKMKGISGDEYPSLPKVDGAETFVLPAKQVRQAIEQVVFSASTNISRFNLTGVLWKLKGKQLKLAATDSYRLAEKTVDFEKDTGATMSLLVPSRTTQELAKILAAHEGEEIQVSASKNQIIFTVDGVELMSKLINDNFPDYESILPESSKTSAVINVEAFMNGLRQVMVIVKESNDGIRMKVGDGKVLVSSDETQVGEGNVELSAETDGPATEVALNAQYLVDVLSHMDDDQVHLGLNDSLSPVMVTPARTSGYLYVIMPLKV